MLVNPAQGQARPNFPGLFSALPLIENSPSLSQQASPQTPRYATSSQPPILSKSADRVSGLVTSSSHHQSGDYSGRSPRRRLVSRAQHTQNPSSDLISTGLVNGPFERLPHPTCEIHSTAPQNEPTATLPIHVRQAQNENFIKSTSTLNKSVAIPSPSPTSTPRTSYAMSNQSSPGPVNPYAARCSLHIRQQPRAARAGPDGKDRRPVDPPPIIQLLITDLDPQSAGDVEELHASFAVHCALISTSSPARDVSTTTVVGEDGSVEIQRLLLGNYVSSPFHTRDDPNPETMPQHPQSTELTQRSPSPSSRFLPSSRTFKQEHPPTNNIPGSFFIFADISVRKAGQYRLEFSLMKMDPYYLAKEKTLPILHKVLSNTFRVVNAKDFDQVQASTPLVRGLIERGAPYPLKLKKGTRDSGRGRSTAEASGDAGEDDIDTKDEDDVKIEDKDN